MRIDAEVTDRREVQLVAVDREQRKTKDDEQHSEIAPAPRPRDVISQHRHHADQEIADPDIARVHQPFRRVVFFDRVVEDAFADIGGEDVGTQSHGEPTQLAKPVFGRCEEQGEQQQVRFKVLAVEPKQAGEQHAERIGSQFVDVGGTVQQHPVQLPPGEFVLHDRRDHQHEQPAIGQRRADDKMPDRERHAAQSCPHRCIGHGVNFYMLGVAPCRFGKRVSWAPVTRPEAPATRQIRRLFGLGSQMPPPAGDVEQHRDHQHDEHPEHDRDVNPASERRRAGKRVSQRHHRKEHRRVPRCHRRLKLSPVTQCLDRNE